MTRRPIGAAAAVVATIALVALVRADPAAADPPVPTDYRSTVDAIEPAADGVRAEVVGGDAFLELTVDRGVEVVVTGYQGEPYLRFRPDGTVERNRRSPATYVNDSRDAVAQVPASADPEADPDWETVGDGGAYAWHDHRIHWMGSEQPNGAEPGEWTKPWTVDIEVDGTPTRINGTLALVDGVNPLPWVALGLAAAAAIVIGGRRRPLHRRLRGGPGCGGAGHRCRLGPASGGTGRRRRESPAGCGAAGGGGRRRAGHRRGSPPGAPSPRRPDAGGRRRGRRMGRAPPRGAVEAGAAHRARRLARPGRNHRGAGAGVGVRRPRGLGQRRRARRRPRKRETKTGAAATVAGGGRR